MKFTNSVVMFDFAGYPMVGNLDTGYIIGLTQDGAQICKKMSVEHASVEEVEAVDKNLYLHLERGGFFKSEAQLDSLTQNSPQIISAYMHVTQRCNLDCAGCYSRSEQRNVLADPSLDEVKKALRFLSDAGMRALIISGGEPFLRKDLDQILLYARKECNVEHITLITNGTIIDTEMLAHLQGNVDILAVSIDGYSEECTPYIRREQRFSRIMETIQKIKDAGIPAHLIPTIHAKNIEDIEPYVNLAEEIGATINFSLLSCSNEDKELHTLLPNEIDLVKLGEMSVGGERNQKIEFRDSPIGTSLLVRRVCGAGRVALSIDADGSVYPCHMLHTSEFMLGNAFSDDTHSILNSPKRKDMLALDIDDLDECSFCDIKYLCGGGCRARAVYAQGRITAKDSYCVMIKESMRLLAERLAQ